MVLVNDCRSDVSPVNNSDSDSDRLESHMTIAVDWDVKPQNNNNKISPFLRKLNTKECKTFCEKSLILLFSDREGF